MVATGAGRTTEETASPVILLILTLLNRTHCFAATHTITNKTREGERVCAVVPLQSPYTHARTHAFDTGRFVCRFLKHFLYVVWCCCVVTKGIGKTVENTVCALSAAVAAQRI